jgi:hypothetical protein
MLLVEVTLIDAAGLSSQTKLDNQKESIVNFVTLVVILMRRLSSFRSLLVNL